MITKGSDYDSVQAQGEGTFRVLPKGGYVCKIMKTEEMTDKNGNPMIHIAFDIAEGDYKGYFMDLFNIRKENRKDKFKEVKYPFEGQMWIQTQDYEDPKKTSRKFKAFCTALEDSGTQVWNGDEFLINNIASAMIGIVYQAQEQEYEGKRSWRTIPWACRSVDAIREGDYFMPDDKPLPEPEAVPPSGFEALSDDDVPFN